MKLFPLKLALAVGCAFSSLFLIYNLFLSVVSNEVAVWFISAIFIELDFRPLIIETGFNYTHFFCGLAISFIFGGIIGFFTAFIYNSISERTLIEEQNSVFRKLVEDYLITIANNNKDDKSDDNDPHNPIGFTHN